MTAAGARLRAGSATGTTRGVSGRWHRGAVLLLVVGAALAGCSSPGADATPVTLSAALLQNRDDYAPRLVQIAITNAGSEAVEISKANFRSPYFSGTSEATHLPYTLGPGLTIDFPAVIPTAVCEASSGAPAVSITARVRNGTATTQVLTPAEPFNSLESVFSQDCGRAAFEKVAAIAPADHLRFEQRAGKEIALLDLAITPTGAPGSVELISTTGTTLLIPVEGDLHPLGLTYSSASPPSILTLAFVPSRCGTHVLAEDKIGTQIPFHARASSFADTYFRVAVSAGVKGEFYDWVGRFCSQ